jgi:alginate O-acetyltransferase complex protein AlgI
MVFSSTIFLFLFLPIIILGNFLLNQKYRNTFLFIGSLFFYFWGEKSLTIIMLSSILINYFSGIGISYLQKQKRSVKPLLTLAIIANLSFLLYYKYFDFFLDNISYFGFKSAFEDSEIILPIGISFFTFQGISYLIDLYRKDVSCQKNIIHLGLYISFFPQLIAGPIIRYHDIASELKSRIITRNLFTEGLVRFIRGLAKKVIIANSLALIADQTFDIAPTDLPTTVAWLGIICYTLQIYFDFSGYSDMAIGLGKMLGFNFKENFNYPYISKSIKEFWRRWHISLSTWFKDYLYIPLGGSRKGALLTYRNLLIVFFITGFWHGASYNFIFWGLFHGAFLILEKTKGSLIEKLPNIIKHIYVLLVVIVGWVFFRAETFNDAIVYLQHLFTPTTDGNYIPFIYVNNYFVFVLCLAIIFAAPVRKIISQKFTPEKFEAIQLISTYGFHFVLFLFSIMELAQSSYNPFIYYRF